jgi:hypothetical protein
MKYLFTKSWRSCCLIAVKCFFASVLYSQVETPKSLSSFSTIIDTTGSEPVKVKEFFEPALMMSYGIIRMNNNLMHGFDWMLKSNLQKNRGPKQKIDDIAQYLPTVAFMGMDLIGVKAKNNLEDRLIYGAAAHLFMGITVNIMKNSIAVSRPDRSATNSFPSGHTATAFVGAELLWQEYKDQSIWYGISGYTLAACTGFFRMYNNRHWFSDIVMGAGIGISSVKLTYLLFPLIQREIGLRNQKLSLVPVFNGVHKGFSVRCRLP